MKKISKIQPSGAVFFLPFSGYGVILVLSKYSGGIL